ncbi:MarR family winged helix-turn-helix transcriptional regulator [Tsukamurella sp. 1534]|uniref:MarR family winged helix-turn-helix transcriptional regulator n=1 Tax=Tsukamurella sp. 1534 TaxID=1151061 RepID=UPI00031E479A|nr:MarR family transcriptional regulator [Tsukamurella sp. 1534]
MSDVGELRYAVHALVRELRAHRRPTELTETQYAILGGLDRGGPATPAELGEAHRVRAQTLTPALNALAADGLVRRRRDDADRRRQFVELTPAGRAVVEADRDARNDWLDSVMDERLTELERGVLLLAAPVLAKLADG